MINERTVQHQTLKMISGPCHQGKYVIIINTYIVKFVVEATSITHWLSVLISSPQSCGGGFAICTTRPLSSCGGLKKIRFKLRGMGK